MKTITFMLLVIAAPCAFAAEEKAKEKAPVKTQLQAFAAETGVVIIKGFTEVGSVTGMGSVTVNCQEFTSAKTGKRSSGITIDVKEAGRLEREGRSYIDSDEIPALVAGIDYISKATPAVTKLKNFEAMYATKDDFAITVFSGTGGKLSVAVSTGHIGRTSAYIEMAKLSALRSVIVQAKQTLDALQK